MPSTRAGRPGARAARCTTSLHLDRLATRLAVWRGTTCRRGSRAALTWSALGDRVVLPVLLLSPFAVRYCRRARDRLRHRAAPGLRGLHEPGQLRAGDDRVHAELPPRRATGTRSSAGGRARGGGRGSGTRRAHLTDVIQRAGAFLTPGRVGCASRRRARRAALARRLPLGREMTVVRVIVIAANQLLDENWAAHKLLDHHNPPRSPRPSATWTCSRAGRCSRPKRRRPTSTSWSTRSTWTGVTSIRYSEWRPRAPASGHTIPASSGPAASSTATEPHPEPRAYHQALIEWVLRYPRAHGPRQRTSIVSFKLSEGRGRQPAARRAGAHEPRWNEMVHYP